MACKGSGVRVPSAPPRFSQLRPLSRLFSMIPPLYRAPSGAPSTMWDCCRVPGPVALVGSGEYLPVMAPVEAALLAGRPPRYVQLPTAAAEEGPGSVARWVALGAEQAQRLGVEAVPVMV